jgi:hypothetical protein
MLVGLPKERVAVAFSQREFIGLWYFKLVVSLLVDEDVSYTL